MSNNKPSKIALLALLTSGCFTSVAWATDFTFSGYATVGVGKVLSGDKHTFYNRECPCYIANFPDVGVYDKSLSFNPDSRFGVQAIAQVDDQTNFTVQITGQGGNNFKPQVDWAYISHDLSNTLTLQAGRKRLPIYQYSDYVNVGYAYPWIRPPSDLYGWQIVNYNGANVLYRNAIGSVGVRANAWIGREDDPNNRMLGQLYYDSKIEETWKNIFGTYAEFTFDAFSVRATYMNNVVDRYSTDASGVRTHATPNVRQRFMGLAFNADWHNIVVKSELNRFERPSVDDNYTSSLVGVGYRIGDVLPMLTYSRFSEGHPPDPSWDEIHHTWTGSVRWDVRPNMAVKLQYDQFTDKSHFTPFAGNSRTLAASVDLIF
ncbi:MAG: hypothetical protein KGI91_00980 [Burkholderiales bacterium]|nr:hypothetical protein [Burkholderiales bacterium]